MIRLGVLNMDSYRSEVSLLVAPIRVTAVIAVIAVVADNRRTCLYVFQSARPVRPGKADDHQFIMTDAYLNRFGSLRGDPSAITV